MPIRITLVEETAGFENPYNNSENENSPTAAPSSSLRRNESRNATTFVGRHINRAASRGLISSSNRHFVGDNDMTASPRLLGYAFSFVASLVVLVSSILFKQNIDLERGLAEVFTEVEFIVEDWKISGAIAFSAVSCMLCSLIMLVHFDTVCLPRVWIRVFKNGSRIERNIIVFLIIFWALGTYTCTSAYSVGYIQPNVYFSSWLCLVVLVHNYDTWRLGAKYKSLYQVAIGSRSPTTLNLVGLGFFSLLSLLSLVDIYTAIRRHSDDPTMKIFDELSEGAWIFSLGVFAGTFGLCLLILVLNHYVNHAKFKSLWIYGEGLILFAFMGVWTFSVFAGTGVTSAINDVSNIYFGVWGSFLFSILTFGSWFQDVDIPLLE